VNELLAERPCISAYVESSSACGYDGVSHCLDECVRVFLASKRAFADEPFAVGDRVVVRVNDETQRAVVKRVSLEKITVEPLNKPASCCWFSNSRVIQIQDRRNIALLPWTEALDLADKSALSNEMLDEVFSFLPSRKTPPVNVIKWFEGVERNSSSGWFSWG